MLVKELQKPSAARNPGHRAGARRHRRGRLSVADPSLAKHIPPGRLGRSDDLAPMALAVLSNRVSAYVTDQRSWSTAGCR